MLPGFLFPLKFGEKDAVSEASLRLTLIAVGHIAEPFWREGIKLYEQRIRRYSQFHLLEISAEKIRREKQKTYILRQEGQKIIEKIPAEAFKIVLDEKGKFITSENLASLINKLSQERGKEIVFIIGGSLGLDERVKKESDLLLSLSPFTLTHGLARILLLEQIYRACTILKGEPYHKK